MNGTNTNDTVTSYSNNNTASLQLSSRDSGSACGSASASESTSDLDARRGPKDEDEKLLLLSEFCKTNCPPRRCKKRIISKKNTNTNTNTTNNNRHRFEYDDTEPSSCDVTASRSLRNDIHNNDRGSRGIFVPVVAHILVTLPTVNHGNDGDNRGGIAPIYSYTNSERDGEDGIGRFYVDPYATVYTSNVKLLHDLQIFDGQICNLSTISHCSNGEEYCSSTPVIVKLLPHNSHVQTVGNDTHQVDEIGTNQRQHQPRHIFVPPTLATNIRLHPTSLPSCHTFQNTIYMSSDIFQRGRRITSPCVSSEISSLGTGSGLNLETISVALKADLVEIGRNPIDFVIGLEDVYKTNFHRKHKQNFRNGNDEALKEYFYDVSDMVESNDNALENKRKGHRLASVGSIIAVQTDHSCHDQVNVETGSLRFYKVIHIEGDNNRQYVHDKSIYWLSPGTQITLKQTNENEDRSNDTDNITSSMLIDNCGRLPRPFIVKQFNFSVKEAFGQCNKTKTKKTKKATMKDSFESKFHSFSTEVARTILAVSTESSYNTYGTKTILSRQMLHVQGDGENSLNTCLDGAADMVGMNIIHVDGLAAFLFRQRAYSSKSLDNSKAIIGTTSDKLAGLRLACGIASRCSPCLLHINIDNELFEHEDEEMCHDEENRLLTTIKDELLSIDSQRRKPQMLLNNFPPVFVVISTSSELRQGPISSSLVNDSIVIESDRDEQKSHNDSKDASSNLIPDVRWEDVGGLSHVRSEIMDAIELPLNHPDLFRKSKRSGILLYGPPGTGKTLIAKAVATECGLPFLSVKGPELLGSYIGESEANIRATFDSAREAASSGSGRRHGAILFFDEIDSLAPRRGGVGDGGGVMERVVATFLTEMDKDLSSSATSHNKGHETPCLVFVIAATNRPDLLDPSLLRPGRFDRLVYLGITKHRKDRVSILTSLTRKFSFENGVSAQTMADEVIDHLPPSLTGADFSAVCNGALMKAVKRLCDQADNELNEMITNCASRDDKMVDVGEILSRWDEDKRIPKVTAADFIKAAQEVVPMIKEEDLKKFETLRNKFES